MFKSLAFMVLATAMASTSIFAETEPPQVLPEGLQLVEKDNRGEIYVDPEIDWSVYDAILLDQATVSFRKNWQRDQNRYPNNFKVKASDMERIKSELAELFNQVFTEELTKNGDYQMVFESGDNALRIRPQIVDLDVYAPDTKQPGIQRSYTQYSGRMTLKLEIYDSVTGDLIATTSNRQDAPRRGYMQWTTSVSNRQDATIMLQRWAKDLRERLDEARVSTL